MLTATADEQRTAEYASRQTSVSSYNRSSDLPSKLEPNSRISQSVKAAETSVAQQVSEVLSSKNEESALRKSYESSNVKKAEAPSTRPDEILKQIESVKNESSKLNEGTRTAETSTIKTFKVPPVKPIEIPPRPPVFEIPASLITNPEARGESPLSENKVATTLKKAMSRAADATTMIVIRTIAAKYTEFIANQARQPQEDRTIVKASKYAHHPKNRAELEELIFVKKVYLGDIDISAIIDLSHLFDCERRHINSIDINFDGIEFWDTSHVIDMSGMFCFADTFNCPIGNWDMSNVIATKLMFYEAKSFNQPIGKWDTSNVADMSKMFMQAKEFNQSIDNWVICNYTNIDDMFIGAESFDMNK